MSGLEVPTGKVRNVLLVGHSGTGKTTLAEAMLHAAGLTNRIGKTTDGSSVLDWEAEEKERHHSLSLSLAAIPFQDHKINIIDTPGGAEAIGDVYPALQAADVAVFVVDATSGIQAQHREIWRACDRLGLPRVVFLNHLDNHGAAYQTNVDALREAYGKPFAPIQMPLELGDDFNGIIDLLHFNAVEFQDSQRIEEDIPEHRLEQAQRNREFLVEAIVENDDELLEAYLEGEIPETKRLAEVFARGIASCGFFPMLCGSAEFGIGAQLLLEFIVEECPAPQPIADRPLDAAPAALVVKTFSDPYVGRINLLRMLSGSISVDDHLIDQRTGNDVRLHQIFTTRGEEQFPVRKVSAGDLVAVAKLDDVRTGDVLAAKGESVEVDALSPPRGYHRVLLLPDSAGDEDKLSTALHRLEEEDPSLLLERDPLTSKLVASSYGPVHVDVTIARLKRKFGVGVHHAPPPIAYRETLKKPAKGLGRHVKQTGGHGQFGVCHLEVAPLDRGAGFEFENKIVGGVIPSQFIPSVEKGVVDAMAKGPLGGFPVVDVSVAVVDGKHHSVDSSDAAFQMAGILGFRSACDEAGVKLLEPWQMLDVVVPDDATGSVMGDISARRGRIMGTEPIGEGLTMIHAQAPEAELLTYAAELRALTKGDCDLAMQFDHYEDVPDNVAQRLIKQLAEEG